MDEMRALLEHFWITREYDKELYFKVKRALPQMQRFIGQQLGWRMVANDKLIKLEKLPVTGESFMGILEFQDPRDYILLCGVLVFLDDLEDNKQFLLSQLIETLDTFLAEYLEVDWTRFTERKSLIRVLKFMERTHMLVVYEGSSDGLTAGIEHEVLYENTGLCRFFPVHYAHNLTAVNSIAELEHLQNEQLDETRGYTRINRVYRTLTLTPAMYWETVEDPDSLYLRNQRQWVQKYMDEALGGRLQIHKNAAFYVLEEEGFGSKHPKDGMLAEVVLLFCRQLRQEIETGKLKRDERDIVILSEDHLNQQLSACKERCAAGFSKEYREMSNDKFFQNVTGYMKDWKMLKKQEQQYELYPAAVKFTGVYPEDFLKKQEDRTND